MLFQFYSSFRQALENLRTNFFHTLLSILGIVIGVASLVCILSLIDGMEKHAREQISSTTSLKNITIRTLTQKTINGVQVRKDSFALITRNDLTLLQQKISTSGKAYLIAQHTSELTLAEENRSLAAMIIGVAPHIPATQYLAFGHDFTEQDMQKNIPVAIINEPLAAVITKDTSYAKLIGTAVVFDQISFKIIGILRASPQPAPSLLIPFVYLDEHRFKQSPPICNIEVEKVEQVPAVKKQVQDWIQDHYQNQSADFECITNAVRVDQVRKGFLLFRIVMGMIVGISIVVGGIGIMNVLLISITERTSEIGIRKAIGANRNDIVRLFLSESITLSILGSVLGIGLGILLTLLAVPIITSYTQAPFQAAFTVNTLITIAVISILIGVIFGTYPARKAAKLDPVVAIQRV